MKTIKNSVCNEIVINKSKFITVLLSVDDEPNALSELDKIKKKYRDATHCCYAYIVDNIKRFNDDKEPSGTAGMPILNVLEKEDLNHLLCVVIRYFGGIKLGVGGLLRAYTSSVKEALKKTLIVELIKTKRIIIMFSYEDVKKIDYILNKCNIINKEYGEKIIYKVDVEENIYSSIISNLKLILNVEMLSEKELLTKE